jgi:hypothetical protein
MLSLRRFKPLFLSFLLALTFVPESFIYRSSLFMGGPGSGRPKAIDTIRNSAQIMHETAPHAARYIRDAILGKIRQPSWAKINLCEYVLDHELGKARVKTEITGVGGTPLNWQMVVLLAKEAEDTGIITSAEQQTGALLPMIVDPQPPSDQKDGGSPQKSGDNLVKTDS